MNPTLIHYLQMLAPSDLRPKVSQDPYFKVWELKQPQWQMNQCLYRWVGSPWHWRDKLPWQEDQWSAYVHDPTLRTFVLYHLGHVAGYYELKHHDSQGVEIAIFGLIPSYQGRGFGGALLTHALEQAWAWHANRVWVHTCDLDHPHAIQNYEARGMQCYRQERPLPQKTAEKSAQGPSAEDSSLSSSVSD